MRTIALFTAFLLFGCASSKPASHAGSNAQGPMQLVSEPAEGIGDPEVTIANVADTAIELDLDGPQALHLAIPSNEERKVKVPVGGYKIRMTVDGVPSEQNFFFSADMRYALKLFIRPELDNPAYDGQGFECFEVKISMPFYNCSRKRKTCEVGRTRVPSEFPTGECEHRAEMVFFRAKNKEGKPSAIFAPTASQCEAFRKIYVDKKLGTEVTECTVGK